jgi:hypothetical protein
MTYDGFLTSLTRDIALDVVLAAVGVQRVALSYVWAMSLHMCVLHGMRCHTAHKAAPNNSIAKEVACAADLCTTRPSITSVLGRQQAAEYRPARLVHCLPGVSWCFADCDAWHERCGDAIAEASAASWLLGCMLVVLLCDCRTSPSVSGLQQRHRHCMHLFMLLSWCRGSCRCAASPPCHTLAPAMIIHGVRTWWWCNVLVHPAGVMGWPAIP